MSSSPLTSLSRTPAQLASLVGMILMPYFSSNFSTEAITPGAQSVNGMKPMRTSFFSGASEPAAQAPPGSAEPAASADHPLMNSRRSSLSSKRGFATLLDPRGGRPAPAGLGAPITRSEENTSELQSQSNIVC